MWNSLGLKNYTIHKGRWQNPEINLHTLLKLVQNDPIYF
jgi:hypothetical protein